MGHTGPIAAHPGRPPEIAGGRGTCGPTLHRRDHEHDPESPADGAHRPNPTQTRSRAPSVLNALPVVKVFGRAGRGALQAPNP